MLLTQSFILLGRRFNYVSNICRVSQVSPTNNICMLTKISSATVNPPVIYNTKFKSIHLQHSLNRYVSPVSKATTKLTYSAMSNYSTNNIDATNKVAKLDKPVTYKDKLKQAMAQYGSTVIVFHITISLISLGTCYMLVASGLDMSALLEKFGLSEKSINKLASSSGTFAAAYLIHKVFAPVRISITLTCTPFIVRYLRKIGVIKKALPKAQPDKK